MNRNEPIRVVLRRLPGMLPFVVALRMLCIGGWAEAQSVGEDSNSQRSTVEYRNPEPSPKNGPAITVAGTVVTAEGKPVTAATVLLRAKIGGQQYTSGLNHNRDILARTQTDASGRFEFNAVPIPPRLVEVINDLASGQPGAELLAWNDGHGLTWTDLSSLNGGDDVHITLARLADVRGTVRDAAGQPIAGATIDVLGATRSNGQYDAFLKQPGDLNFSLSEIEFASRSDAEGRFSLANLPEDFRFLVACTRPGYARQLFILDTAAEKRTSQMRATNAGGRVTPVVQSPLEFVLEPRRFVLVKVVDHDGQRVRSGNVQAVTPKGHFAGQSAVDADGTARIPLAEPGKYRFYYGSDPLEPKLSTSITAEIGDDKPAEVVITLPRPRWLTVRVTESGSDKPVVGAYVSYVSTADAMPASEVHSLAVSGEEGELRMPVLAGKGRLGFARPVHGYLAQLPGSTRGTGKEIPTVEITIPEKGDPEPVQLRLGRGLVVQGIVVDDRDQPLAGAVVRGQTRLLQASAQTDHEGKFELAGLSPYEEARIVVAHDNGGALETVAAEPEQPPDQTRVVNLNLKAEPGVTLAGRVLKDHQPQAGVRMRLFRSNPGRPNQYYFFDERSTDAKGSYAFAGLKPGERYYFEVATADGSTAPGWQHQMPYIQKVPRGERTTIDLPVVQLVSRGQSLAGVVVDPQGQPVPGLTVSPRLVSGAPLSMRGRRPNETDAEGKFTIENLPDQPLELMIWKRNPRGGRIDFPARVSPAMNQQDIRVIFDPTLTSEVEDLDASAGTR